MKKNKINIFNDITAKYLESKVRNTYNCFACNCYDEICGAYPSILYGIKPTKDTKYLFKKIMNNYNEETYISTISKSDIKKNIKVENELVVINNMRFSFVKYERDENGYIFEYTEEHPIIESYVQYDVLDQSEKYDYVIKLEFRKSFKKLLDEHFSYK